MKGTKKITFVGGIIPSKARDRRTDRPTDPPADTHTPTNRDRVRWQTRDRARDQEQWSIGKGSARRKTPLRRTATAAATATNDKGISFKIEGDPPSLRSTPHLKNLFSLGNSNCAKRKLGAAPLARCPLRNQRWSVDSCTLRHSETVPRPDA